MRWSDLWDVGPGPFRAVRIVGAICAWLALGSVVAAIVVIAKAIA